MKRRRHTPEQAVRKLCEGERLLNGGAELGSVLRELEITESTWNRWRSTYGGMKAAGVKRLNELEAENARLKKLLAEAELDKAMLKDLAEGKWRPRTAGGLLWCGCGTGSGCHSGGRARWWASIAGPSGARRRRVSTRMSPLGSGCAASRSPIPAGDGARPTTSPPARAWWSTPSAPCVCGAPTTSSVPPSSGASGSASVTAPLRGCAPSTPTMCGRWRRVRRDRRPPTAQAARRHRRVHPRSPGHPRGSQHRRRWRRRHGRADRRPQRSTQAAAHGQRPRARRRRTTRLVPPGGHRHCLHRARRAVGERLDRILQRPAPRRMPPASRTSPTSSKPESSSRTGDTTTTTTGPTDHSADKHPPPTLPTTDRPQDRTPITAGPTNGSPSQTPTTQPDNPPSQPTNTHNNWTDYRVPVSCSQRCCSCLSWA